MISSNTRTRSRYSSPARQPGIDGSKGSSSDGSRLCMKRWLEPSVQAKPSFEEAGLMRYGVLENMAPLGAMPKAKKPVQENGHGVRKIILKASSAKAASSAPASPTRQATRMESSGAAATDAASPPPPATPSPVPTSPKASTAPTSRQPVKISLTSRLRDQDDEDEDYDPKGSNRRRLSARSTAPKKGRPSASDRRSSMTSVKSTQAKSSAPPAIPGASHDAAFTKKVIDVAVEEALKHYRYPTAWALQSLYDEKSEDAEFVAMIEDVFSQTADSRTMKEFSNQVEERKREGKKDNRGCYHFLPPTTNSRFTPRKPKPAPYASLLERPLADEPEEEEEEEKQEIRPAKKIKLTHSGRDKTPRKLGRLNGANKNSGSLDGEGAGGSVRAPGSRKRARRSSMSSESSLSSAMSLSSPEVNRKAAGAAAQDPQASPSLRVRVSAKAASGAGATGRIQSQPETKGAPKQRPISTRTKGSVSSKDQRQGASNPNISSASGAAKTPNHNHRRTHQQHHHRQDNNSITTKSAADDASMPGRIAASEPPVIAPAKSTHLLNKSGAKAHMSEERNDEYWTRRRDAHEASNDYAAMESSVREGEETRVATPTRKPRKTRQSLVLSHSTRATRSASKRTNDGHERTSSPGIFSTQGDESSVFGSRAATPTTDLPPPKKHKTGLRIKLSPVKRKGGTAAGVPRSMGDAQSSAANGTAKDQNADNDESCSACGNAGDVVCCDGCPRSFHFECVDMNPEEHLPDEWYCNECIFRKFPSRVPVHKGIFGSALNNLEKTIPRAFSLPKKVQNRFEGVKAGADGDYEEVNPNKGKQKKNNGYDEAPDFFKLREDGEPVLCHDCQKSATDIRAIIPCSICSLYWHIDCLDPPLAVPPVLKTWRCPAHADDVLAEASPLAPAHRFRKVKGASVITPAIGRGLKNNGHIEIDWSEEPDEDDNSGWRELSSFGRVYKIPAKGVVLDFIEQYVPTWLGKPIRALALTRDNRLRNQGAGYGSRRDEPRQTAPYLTPPVEENVSLLSGYSLERNIEEVQTSLILTSLKQTPAEGVEHLTSALLGDADNIARRSLAGNDRVSLRALLTQIKTMESSIRSLLADEDQSKAHPALLDHESASAFSESKPSKEKLDSEALVTEPTPPSTIDHVEGAMDFD